jgi:hypothetical protein
MDCVESEAVGELDSLHGQEQELPLLAMPQPCQPFVKGQPKLAALGESSEHLGHGRKNSKERRTLAEGSWQQQREADVRQQQLVQQGCVY